MASKIMLIDGVYDEQKRVAILNDKKLDDYDVEVKEKRDTRGNIYLGRIARLEPSLQAVFVEFGEHKNGFLPFDAVHPAYYNISAEQKEKLLRLCQADPDEEDSAWTASSCTGEAEETVAAGGAVRPSKHYRMQDVLTKGQTLLVQVTKSTRGDKGEALTTYLALLGRFCILQPQSLRSHIGVSQKLSEAQRTAWKTDLLCCQTLLQGHTLIVRSASAEASLDDVMKDLHFLLRLWDDIRKQAVYASPPTLIYQEGDLIAQSLRDLYRHDIDQIIVDGDKTYERAQSIMRLMMPTHVSKIQRHEGLQPLFHAWSLEDKIDQIYSPRVPLPSGGNIVIAQTEALVAIDVNSAKAKGGRNIAETAFQTNMEAAEEIARQFRVRDLAGLIVIDFIDMGKPAHQQALYERMTELLASDRSKTTIGSVTGFGLMEVARQRLRFSFLENQATLCQTCGGTGMVCSIPALTLRVLRELTHCLSQDAAFKTISVFGIDKLIMNLINSKRHHVAALEQQFQVVIHCFIDNNLPSPHFCLKMDETLSTASGTSLALLKL